ncbi:MAG: VWA domain-containing protein [Chloroflexi bacterium]|nr:VWA domain-containing protein [Chloroflexota bacterium]
MRKRKHRSSGRAGTGWFKLTNRTIVYLLILVAVIASACALCTGGLIIATKGLVVSSPSSTNEATLTVAYSPEKAALFQSLVKQFNAQGLKSAGGLSLQVTGVEMEPEAMIGAATTGQVQAITPDSSLWLDQVDQAWRQEHAGDTQSLSTALVGETTRYAVSPVVIAMWEDVARRLGYPDKAIGWQDILQEARQNPDFKWSHPSTSTSSGLLATLAEFYAGAGLFRDLTKEAAQAQTTLDYVAAMEKTVRYYGEGELAVMERARKEGPSFLDAFVVQEQLVVDFNRTGGPAKLVAIYPKEGALWEDHPLALLERPELTAAQRLTYARLREFLLSSEVQQQVLAAGYRPVDLNIRIDGPQSPITAENGADPVQPQTTLQIPSTAVVQVVKDVWWYTKRHTNVYLVVDISGSMEGEKLTNVQTALQTFVGQIKGDEERVGLITFSEYPKVVVPLDNLGNNREELQQTIAGLEAKTRTALLDAVDLAYRKLQNEADSERINAIVVMTDGKENASGISMRALTREIKEGNKSGVPVVIFAIAYGRGADTKTLRSVAEASGGQVRTGDLETIQGLYKILSTYF